MAARGTAGPLRESKLVTMVGIVALVVIPLIFFAGMILGGKEPAAVDTISVRPLGEWALETQEEMGTTPLWVPHLFSGMPSYGSYVYTPASPLSLIDHVLRLFPEQRGVRYFLLMLIGGFSAFAFFRRQGASTFAAATVALGFVLTPYIPGAIEAGHSTKLKALMLAPLVLLALDYFLSRPGALAASLLAIATAMIGWANHPQILYYMVMIGFLYAVGRVFSERNDWNAAKLAVSFGWLCLAGLVTFCLLAEPTLAVREYAPYSIRGAGESGGTTWEYATGWSFAPREVISFLFPEFYGLKSPVYFGFAPFTQSTHYVGIVFLAVALIAWIRRRDARSWIWITISLVVLLIGFGRHLPILYRPLFEFLPYFNKFRVPPMIYSLLPLTLGFLVAKGLDALATPGERDQKKKAGGSRKRWLIPACAAGGLAVVIYLVASLTKSSGMLSPEWIRPGEAQQLGAEQLEELRSQRYDLRVVSMVRGLILIGLFFAAVPVARRLKRPFGVALLGVIVLVDILIVGAKFTDFQEKERVEAVLQPTQEIEYLSRQDGPFRVLPVEEFGSNRFVAFDITTVGGYQPAKLRLYQDLLDQGLLNSPAVLSMLNVRYLLTSRDPSHPAFEKVAEGVYRFEEGLPRAWFVPSWRSVPAGGPLLGALGSQGFDPAAVAYFSPGDEPAVPSDNLPLRETSLVAFDPHHLRFEVGPGSDPGLLIISEVYYPAGWGATIDGTETEILRANHCLRAVVVPPGEHVVEMRFDPSGYRLGRRLNRAGGIASLLLLGLGAWLERRRRSPMA